MQVLAAVKNHWRALFYASDAMKNDCEVVLEAAKNFWYALDFAGPLPRNDPEIIDVCLGQSGRI